ncbi:MAG: hypothetical protein ACE5OR_17800 [bacterium]
MLKQASPFVFSSDDPILTGRPRGEEILDSLMDYLKGSESDRAFPLDFSNVEFLDISCADEFLTKLLLRIRSGELETRFVFVQNANLSVKETLQAVLQLRGIAILMKDNGGVEILGEIKRPIREALEILIERKRVTSAELAEALNKSVNIACNRLNLLQRMGLACRLREDSLPGGGRRYYYESIL